MKTNIIKIILPLFFIVVSDCQEIIEENIFHTDRNFKSDHLISNYEDDYYRFLLNYLYKNQILNYHQKFYDKNNIYLSLSFQKKIGSKALFVFSSYLENVKTYAVDINHSYWNDNFFGYSGDVEKSYLLYKNDRFFFKIGRDYFLPGFFSYDRMLFSSDGYPYDHLVYGYKNKNLSINSFYLLLSPHPKSSIENRHLNGHRINYKFKNGYFAFNEIIIYGGENKSPDFALFNPLIPYYVYHRNHGNFISNSIISFEFLYSFNSYQMFVEFLLDDIQIEKETSSDLEPAEYGILFELNKYINANTALGFNFIKISNRTFNAPVYIYEKYVNKNFPIGHIMGNNFWSYNLKYEKKIKNWTFLYQFSHLFKGEEALYSEFNQDYLDSSVEEGYQEDFPFGQISEIRSNTIELIYSINDFLYLTQAISYWDKTYYDNTGLNFSFSITYDFFKN